MVIKVLIDLFVDYWILVYGFVFFEGYGVINFFDNSGCCCELIIGVVFFFVFVVCCWVV